MTEKLWVEVVFLNRLELEAALSCRFGEAALACGIAPIVYHMHIFVTRLGES